MSEGFFEVGCRACGKGSNENKLWILFSDGKGKFKAVHSCGHKISLPAETVKKPDEKGIDMRFF